MIVNDKFVEPTGPKPQPPLKKTQDYYNVYGNLWNHSYFSSRKISQYYLDSLTPTPSQQAKNQLDLFNRQPRIKSSKYVIPT